MDADVAAALSLRLERGEDGERNRRESACEGGVTTKVFSIRILGSIVLLSVVS
jgi:hypothetical protein